MLTKKDRLALMVRGLHKVPAPKHCLLAVEVLTEVTRELQRQGYVYQEDFTWPYHVLVPTEPGRHLSLYCGGFRKDIDVQQLKLDGTADTRFKEARFRTPEGAVNYLRRRVKW